MLTMTATEKLRTLLPHWIEHNAAHAAEFRRWAAQAGKAQADIESAAARIEAANEALAAALAKLDGPSGDHEHDPHHHRHGS